jgi:hypothetical protein
MSAICSSRAKIGITRHMTNTAKNVRQATVDAPATKAGASAPHGFVWTRKAKFLSAFAVVATWIVAASIWPATDTVVPWDSKNHFYPMLRYLGASFASGEMPLWNPYHFSGHPAVADPQSLLFTPTMALFGWLWPSPSMQVFDVVVFAHLLAGGLAVLGLVQRRGWRPEGAVLAAVIFMLGGSAAARLQHTGMIISYSFLPIALLCLETTLARRSCKAAIAFGITAALMALGRDQVAFLGCVLLIIVTAAHFMTHKHRLNAARTLIGPLGLAGVISASILVIPAILTIQFLSTSNRPDIAFGVAAMGSLPPQSLATLLFADIFGSLRFTFDYWGPSAETLAEGTWTDRSIQYVFAGTLPALLLLWFGLARGHLMAREARLFALLLVVAVIYALGWYTPLFGYVFDFIPGISLYRRPADATFLINFAIAGLAAYFLHIVIVGKPSSQLTSNLQRNRLKLICGALVVAMLALAASASGIWHAARMDKVILAWREIAIGGVISAALAFGLYWSNGSMRRRALFASLAVALTSAELVIRHAASGVNAEPSNRYAAFEKMPADQLQGLRVLERELALRHAKGERPRVEILGLSGAWQNAAMVFGLEDTIGYNPLRIADYELAVGPGENSAEITLRQFPRTFRGYRCNLASLLGLEYLVLDRPIEKLPKNFPTLTGTSLIYGMGSMWVYRLSPSSPRTYFATELVKVDSHEVLKNDDLPDFDRLSEALVDQESVAALKGDYGLKDPTTDPDPAKSSIQIKSYRRNAVTIEVETDRSGVLVLHDIYYPGWKVYVDGQEKPVLKANLLFRGVEITPGWHRVEFKFEPFSVGNLSDIASALIKGDSEDGGS